MNAWISIEGVESAGKTELVKAISNRRPEWPVLSGFSKTPLGQLLAEGFRHDPYIAQPPAAAQAMMVFADFVIRWQNELRPLLCAGHTVLTDRGWLSKLVYQTAILETGPGNPGEFDASFAYLVMSKIPQPTLTILLMPQADIVHERLSRAGVVGQGRREMIRRILDTFEKAASTVDRLVVLRELEEPDALALRVLNEIDSAGQEWPIGGSEGQQ